MRIEAIVLAVSTLAAGCHPTNGAESSHIDFGDVLLILAAMGVLPLVVILLWVRSRLFAVSGRLKADGEQAMAQILHVDQGMRTVAFDLLVQRQGQVPYQARSRPMRSTFSLFSRVQQGKIVPVLVDPSNPLCVALDLERPMAPPGSIEHQLTAALQQATMPQQEMAAQGGLPLCPSCHQPLPPGLPACPSCGAPLRPQSLHADP